MPKFTVSVPVYVHLIHTVEAADDYKAIEAPIPRVYMDASGGLSIDAPSDAKARLCVPTGDDAFDFAEIEAWEGA